MSGSARQKRAAGRVLCEDTAPASLFPSISSPLPFSRSLSPHASPRRVWGAAVPSHPLYFHLLFLAPVPEEFSLSHGSDLAYSLPGALPGELKGRGNTGWGLFPSVSPGASEGGGRGLVRAMGSVRCGTAGRSAPIHRRARFVQSHSGPLREGRVAPQAFEGAVASRGVRDLLFSAATVSLRFRGAVWLRVGGRGPRGPLPPFQTQRYGKERKPFFRMTQFCSLWSMTRISGGRGPSLMGVMQPSRFLCSFVTRC